MRDRLTAFQREVLLAFFERTDACYLTGGAALAGFHLGHRTTYDLDLFTLDDRLEEAERALAETASAIGASIERVQTAPDFRRRLVTRGPDSVVVDLVRERVAQGADPKQRFGAVIVDPPSEILANKLCALLSRSEVRDLVDVLVLERSGQNLERAYEL
jgi:predicted nucleotidyltransferase component of viral defense system